jgi:hypothetical protein
MKPRTLVAVAAGALVLGGLGWRISSVEPAQANAAAPAMTKAEMVERGKYLVTTSGCHDCHTPLKMGANGPEPDMTLALSGHPDSMVLPPPPPPSGPWLTSVAATNTAWSGPWGVSFTANLTPDKETGLGAWTEENFLRTIRTGRHLGNGRPILPPMPIPVYSQMKDEDLKSIYWYLQSLPPTKNRVPTPLPPAAPG